MLGLSSYSPFGMLHEDLLHGCLVKLLIDGQEMQRPDRGHHFNKFIFSSFASFSMRAAHLRPIALVDFLLL